MRIAGRPLALLVAMLLAVFAPLPFGSVSAAARIALAGALAAGLLLVWLDRRTITAPPARYAVLTAATLALVALYLVPLPPAVVGVLSPRLRHEARLSLAAADEDATLARAEEAVAGLAGSREPGGWRPLATDPDGALEGATRVLLALGAFLLGLLAAGDHRAGRHRLAAAVGLSAFAQAAYGLAEALSGHHSILGWYNPFYVPLATGTFVCANHFAALLSLGLFALVGLLAAQDRHRHRHHARDGRADSDEGGSHLARTAVLVTAAGLIAIAMLWSSSRAALAGAAGGLLLFAVLLLVKRGVARQGVALLVLEGVLAVGLVAGAALLRPVQPLVQDLERTSSAFVDRERLWQLAIDAARAFPWVGAGPGTFDTVHRLFRPGDVGVRVTFAHNDYAQWLAEAGVLGLLLISAWLLAIGAGAIRLFRRGRDRALTAALGAGLLALALHEAFDFSLQLPGVSIPAALLAGGLLAPLPWRPGAVEDDAPRGSRLWPALVLCASAALFVAGTATWFAERTLASGSGRVPAYATPEQLIDWSRSEVDDVLAAAGRAGGAVDADGRRRLGAAFLAARRAVVRAPLRSEAQIACWVASQALVSARAPEPPPADYDALARHYLERAIALDPANRGRRLQVARYWLSAGKVPEARRQVHDLLEMDAAWADRAYEMLGGADLDLSDLMAATPNRPRAAVALARYLQGTRKDSEAAQIVLQRALARAPDDAELRLILTWTLLSRRRPDQALETIDGHGLPPQLTERVRALQARAAALLALRRFDDHARVVDQLTALGEEPRRLALARAQAQSAQGDHEGAVRTLTAALERRGRPIAERDMLSLLVVLGAEQNQAGLVREALETFRRAQKIDPQHPTVRAFFASLDRQTSLER